MEFLSSKIKLTIQAALAVFILLTYSQQNWARDAFPLDCKLDLESHSAEIDLEPLLKDLHWADTPKKAIATIVGFLRSTPGSARQKHKAWESALAAYNNQRPGTAIIAPCKGTLTGEILCWGEDWSYHLYFRDVPGQLSADVGTSTVRQRPRSVFVDGLRVIDINDPAIRWWSNSDKQGP